MTLKIDANEFLKIEAAQKALEILGCSNLFDLSEIDVGDERYAQHQASELADRLLAALRPHLINQIVSDAQFLAADCALAHAALDTE